MSKRNMPIAIISTEFAMVERTHLSCSINIKTFNDFRPTRTHEVSLKNVNAQKMYLGKTSARTMLKELRHGLQFWLLLYKMF